MFAILVCRKLYFKDPIYFYLFCLASINKFIDLLGSLGTDLAVWNDASSDEPAAPNDTPTASPSGIL